MARSNLVNVLLVLGLTRLGRAAMSGAQSFVFDFTSDMEGWASYRGSWRWADRAHLNHTLPSGSSDDGFALLDEANNSDELYTPYVSAPFGATAVLRFFLRSQWQGSNTMYVSLMEPGQSSKLFLELSHYGSPMSNSWVTVSGEIPPMDNDVLMAIFCYNGNAAPVGSLMYGCAIDQIEIDIHGEETTAAPTEPQTTAAPTEPETTAAPTEPQTTAAPTEPQTTAAPTEPQTTAAPTEPQTTAAPTEPQTTAAPTEPQTTAAPTEPQTTAAPTEPQTTAAPTVPQTAAPTVPQTTAAPTEPQTTAAPTVPQTTAAPTEPQTTAAPTEPQTTAAPTEPQTTAAPTEPQTTAAPTASETTAAPTEPQTTAAPTEPQTTAVPTEPETTAAPTEPQTTAAPTEPQTTAAPTEPETTAAPTEPQTTAAPTEPETTAAPTEPETTAAPTEPETTAAPTEPETTAAPTEPETTAAPTEPETTAAPTEPETTAGPTKPQTTAAPTEPETTAAPTEPQTTAAPTEPQTTAAPTEPQTTAAPTEPQTTAAPTEPQTTAAPTEPQTTAAPTEPQTTAAPTEPQTTAAPTEPQTTAAPTEPQTTAAPTEPQTTAAPTEPQTTAAPTEPQTTAAPTEPQTTAAPTEPQTTEAPTTEGPSGPLIFDFQSSVQGWTLSEMNGAAWRRVTFDNTDHVVTAPPEGAKVLQVFPTHVFSGTTLAQSPLLEAVSETVRVKITFWMDGTHDFPTQLKVRKRTDFSTFDINPVMNLDPFGDQENHKWIAYSATLRYMTIGQTFTLNLEGSIGSNPNNSVAVNKVELEGVKAVQNDFANLVDFENGLFGWSTGNMDGGRWVLQSWSDLDPSLYVPKPSDGKNFLFVNRFDIHSGVISLESPAFPIQAGQRKKVHIKFWIRGSVVYPAALRLRKKSVNGAYDDLPFLNLAGYGDVDNPDWIFLDKQYYIPVDETEDAFQIVVEADLGSDMNNLVALDDLRIITEYISA
ncbi:mucin-5AC [Penaeus vannamei]|uniref:mucin-5AC n=1 Tax=Penaeus vannamei TaxID=6689 RepID=UPI00387F932A